MTHDEMIAVITAHRDGKVIQSRFKGNPEWVDCVGDIKGIDFEFYVYHIKPEPKEIWVRSYASINKNSFVGTAFNSLTADTASNSGGPDVVCYREVIE